MTENNLNKEAFDELVRNIPDIGDLITCPDWDPGNINVCSMDREVTTNSEGVAHVCVGLDTDRKLKAWVNAKILPYRKSFKWFLSGDYHQGLKCYLSQRALINLTSQNSRLDLLHIRKVRVIDQVERESSKYLVVDLV